MRILIALVSLAMLAACGADGEPIRPTEPKYSAKVGIGTSGVRTGGRVSFGLGKTQVTIGTGL